jgi:hypothetical protein
LVWSFGLRAGLDGGGGGGGVNDVVDRMFSCELMDRIEFDREFLPLVTASNRSCKVSLAVA